MQSCEKVIANVENTKAFISKEIEDLKMAKYENN